ncbi:MAG: metallophosphoesterase [Oscillospiraceae bacterium]|nr:metallophosphoesterase [Oscillospiraceae bacterium]
MYSKRISKSFESASEIEFSERDKFVIFSDIHRGTGDVNDNFAANQNIFFYALSSYYDKGYTYIELGDGDELWENKRIEPIIAEYCHIFWLIDKFHRDGRMIMLYGNHDIVKRSEKWRSAHISKLPTDSHCSLESILDGAEISETLILRNSDSGKAYYLIHGHQAELLNSSFWRLSKFLVRHIWRPLESLGVKQPLGTAEHRAKMEKTEKRLINWCKETGNSLIAGHTHRPRFPDGEAEYFNAGSCVHPRCVTAIEIAYGAVNLVKWSVEPDGSILRITRTELETIII